MPPSSPLLHPHNLAIVIVVIVVFASDRQSCYGGAAWMAQRVITYIAQLIGQHVARHALEYVSRIIQGTYRNIHVCTCMRTRVKRRCTSVC